MSLQYRNQPMDDAATFARLHPVTVIPLSRKTMRDLEYPMLRKGLVDVLAAADIDRGESLVFQDELVDGLLIARPESDVADPDEERTMTVTREGGSWRVFLPDEDVEKLHLSLDEGRVLAYAGDRVLAFETVQSRTLPIGGDDAE